MNHLDQMQKQQREYLADLKKSAYGDSVKTNDNTRFSKSNKKLPSCDSAYSFKQDYTNLIHNHITNNNLNYKILNAEKLQGRSKGNNTTGLIQRESKDKDDKILNSRDISPFTKGNYLSNQGNMKSLNNSSYNKTIAGYTNDSSYGLLLEKSNVDKSSNFVNNKSNYNNNNNNSNCKSANKNNCLIANFNNNNAYNANCTFGNFHSNGFINNVDKQNNFFDNSKNNNKNNFINKNIHNKNFNSTYDNFFTSIKNNFNPKSADLYLNNESYIIKLKSEVSDLKYQLNKAHNEVNVLKEKIHASKLNSESLEKRTLLFQSKFTDFIENLKIENSKLKSKNKEVEKSLEFEKEKFIKLENEFKYLSNQIKGNKGFSLFKNINNNNNNYNKKENNTNNLAANFNTNNHYSNTNFNTNPNFLEDSSNPKSNSEKKEFSNKGSLVKINSHKVIKTKMQKSFLNVGRGTNKSQKANKQSDKNSINKLNKDENNKHSNYNREGSNITSNYAIEINLCNEEGTNSIFNSEEKLKSNKKPQFKGEVAITKKFEALNKNIPNLNLDNLENQNLRFSFDCKSDSNYKNDFSNKENTAEKIEREKNKKDDNDSSKINLCEKCHQEIKELINPFKEKEIETQNKFSFENNRMKINEAKDTTRNVSSRKDSNVHNVKRQSDPSSEDSIKDYNLFNNNINHDDNEVRNFSVLAEKETKINNKLSTQNVHNFPNILGIIPTTNKNSKNNSTKNIYVEKEKDILNSSNKNTNISKLSNSSFVIKKKYKEKYTKKFGKLLSSTLGVFLDIIELLISSKPINMTARDSVLKTNPNCDNVSYSIDIYESSYNCEEDRRNILIEQIQSLIISKLRFMQGFSEVNLEKEILKVKSWSAVFSKDKDNNSILSNMSNTKLIMMRRENKEKDISYTSSENNSNFQTSPKFKHFSIDSFKDGSGLFKLKVFEFGKDENYSVGLNDSTLKELNNVQYDYLNNDENNLNDSFMNINSAMNSNNYFNNNFQNQNQNQNHNNYNTNLTNLSSNHKNSNNQIIINNGVLNLSLNQASNKTLNRILNPNSFGSFRNLENQNANSNFNSSGNNSSNNNLNLNQILSGPNREKDREVSKERRESENVFASNNTKEQENLELYFDENESFSQKLQADFSMGNFEIGNGNRDFNFNNINNFEISNNASNAYNNINNQVLNNKENNNNKYDNDYDNHNEDINDNNIISKERKKSQVKKANSNSENKTKNFESSKNNFLNSNFNSNNNIEFNLIQDLNSSEPIKNITFNSTFKKHSIDSEKDEYEEFDFNKICEKVEEREININQFNFGFEDKGELDGNFEVFKVKADEYSIKKFMKNENLNNGKLIDNYEISNINDNESDKGLISPYVEDCLNINEIQVEMETKRKSSEFIFSRKDIINSVLEAKNNSIQLIEEKVENNDISFTDK